MSIQPTLTIDVGIKGFLIVNEFIGVGSQIITTTASQSGTLITGTLGDFTAAMVGSVIEYANLATAFIVQFTDAYHLVSTVSLTEPLQSAIIIFNGTQSDKNGLFAITLACVNFYATDIFCTNLTVFNDATVGHNLSVGNVTDLNILNTTGNASIGGTLTSAGLITGPNLVITNNITAGGTIQGQTITAIGNVNATNVNCVNVNATGIVTAPTVDCTNLTSTGTITAATINASGTITANTLNAGAGGVNTGANVTGYDGIFSDSVQSPLFITPASSSYGFRTTNGSYETTNGSFTTTNGSISAMNGMVQAGSLIISGASQLLGSVQMPAVVSQVGSLVIGNTGGYLNQQLPGSAYQPLLVNPAYPTGLQWGLLRETILPLSVNNWSGGTLRFELLRIDRIVTALIQPAGTFTSNAPIFSTIPFTTPQIGGTSYFLPSTPQEVAIFSNSNAIGEPFRFQVVQNSGNLVFNGIPMINNQNPSSSWAGPGVTLELPSFTMTWLIS
jgi:hypothetical protein